MGDEVDVFPSASKRGGRGGRSGRTWAARWWTRSCGAHEEGRDRSIALINRSRAIASPPRSHCTLTRCVCAGGPRKNRTVGPADTRPVAPHLDGPTTNPADPSPPEATQQSRHQAIIIHKQPARQSACILCPTSRGAPVRRASSIRRTKSANPAPSGV